MSDPQYINREESVTSRATAFVRSKYRHLECIQQPDIYANNLTDQDGIDLANALEKRIPGIHLNQMIRNAYIDRTVSRYLDRWKERNGPSQVVIVGVGLDMRPYLFKNIWPKQTKTFAIDLPKTMESRLYRLRVLGVDPLEVTHIKADLSQHSLVAVLGDQKNFNFKSPTIFIWEGVFEYLTEQAIANGLAYCAQSGDSVVITGDYHLPAPQCPLLVEVGEPNIGIDERLFLKYVDQAGFRVIDNRAIREYATEFSIKGLVWHRARMIILERGHC